MGWRYYSPTYCRFLTRDPSGYEGGINVYAYCRNNPIMRCDPTGLDFVNLSPNAVAQAIARLAALRTSSSVAEAVQYGLSAAELLSASLPPSQTRDTVAVADPFGNYHQQHIYGQPEVGAFIYQQGDSGPVVLGPLLSGDPNSITFGQPKPPVGFHTVGTLHTHPRVPLTVDAGREYFSSLDASSGVNTGLLQPGFGTAYLGAPSGNIYSLSPSNSFSANGQPSPDNVTTRPLGPGGTVIGRHWGIWKFTALRPPMATLR